MIETRLQTLSDIYVIGEKQVNPNAEVAEHLIENLCKSTGIWLPHFQDYTTMASYLFPRTTVERLVSIGLVYNLLYYIDDIYDRHMKDKPNPMQELYLRKVFENCIRIIMQGYQPEDHHLVYPICYELHMRFNTLSTSKMWMKRFISSLLRHLNSTTYSLDDIVEAECDMVEQYISLRELDAGMDPTMDFIEFATDVMIPTEILHHPTIRKMSRHCSIFASLANDLFSYEKEVVRFNSRFNLVAVLMDSWGYTFEEAVHNSVRFLNRSTADYLKNEANLPVWKDEEWNRLTQLYVEGLRDQILATWYWQMSTNRYRSPDSPFPELRTLL